MQKTIMLTVAIAIAFSLNAQKLKDSQVPSAAKSAFTKAHPNMQGAWEKEDNNYEVVYKVNGKTMSSVFNKNGSELESETDLSVNELPESIQSYLKQHYKNAKTKGAAEVVREGGKKSYEVSVNGKEMLFDDHGKILKKQKEEEDEENEGNEHKTGKKAKD